MPAFNAVLKFANNVSARLNSDVTVAASTLQVAAGQGARFPTLAGNEYFVITLIDPDSGAWEVANVVARSGDTLTLERGAEGSTPRVFLAATSYIVMTVTAGMLDKFMQKTA